MLKWDLVKVTNLQKKKKEKNALRTGNDETILIASSHN